MSADAGIPVRNLTAYNEDKGTLIANEEDRLILVSNLSVIYTVEVINDGSTNDIEVNFDATDRPAITVKAGEARSINYPVKKVYLTNTGSGTVTYRVLLTGEAVR